MGPVRHAFWSDFPKEFIGDRKKSVANQKILAEHKIHSLGDVLTPEGEYALYSLQGTGIKSLMALQRFLTDNGFSTDWPKTESIREQSRERSSRIKLGRGPGLSLERAIEEADRQYAARKGKPVGEFSRKLLENIEAQEKGARLKGRRTL